MRAAAIIIMSTVMTDAVREIYRLSVWLSPAFPVGAYTYSSGLEYAVEAGLVMDANSLQAWLTGLFQFGSGAVDGAFFCLAHRAAAADHAAALGECLDWADALRPTSELALESASQGEAFLKTVRAAWPHEGVERLESVRRLYVGLQSFRSMSRMDASLMKASALRLRFSQSLASRRQRLSQAMVRSTTQRLGWTTKPFTRSDRLTISVSRSGRMPARAR